MINSKSLSKEEKFTRISKLIEEHTEFFKDLNSNEYVFIPKMAYRPSGKDEKFITFFPSELENECDIYTEFVSKTYQSEDLKRTLYMLKHNPFWREEYELNTSKSGFTTHLIPLTELKVINDITTRKKPKPKGADFDIDQPIPIQEIKKPKPPNKNIPPINIDIKDLVSAIEDINYTLQTLNHILRNKK
jgi:hypothetical protein